ncbi:hypothetical protein [Actinomadura rubrisoli]|uniref:PA containing protein n=1 Tax=Actinomadura rubrisoli TaxID=2530368 RepID=A0A4R5AV51_9ACTN|nr:hypothetical protein [Actinomadura rubrisoli]TDD75034.1 hypothetical protein E1298_32005 [Actinomadura rubrisoli]
MTIVPGLVRRAATEAERQLREGAGLLARLGRDLERSADLGRLLPSYGDRIRDLEERDRARDAELGALRTEVESLVTQLNDRLLPRIDERMDDTERDLTAVATSLIRAGRDTAGYRARLEAAERRIGDLRTKLAQMEQRSGLWRDLQASMARLGDDIDGLRARVALGDAEPEPDQVRDPVPDPIREALPGSMRGPVHEPMREREPVQRVGSEHITDRPA